MLYGVAVRGLAVDGIYLKRCGRAVEEEEWQAREGPGGLAQLEKKVRDFLFLLTCQIEPLSGRRESSSP